MSREKKYTAFILKKQAFGEADEIITLFTEELGKIRVMAKSSKISKSKLQHALQPMFLCAVTVAGQSQLPKIIHAEVISHFALVRSNNRIVEVWFGIAELLLKATPDGQKNLALFQAVTECLNFLNQDNLPENLIILVDLKFRMLACQSLGFGMQIPKPALGLVFNPDRGFCASVESPTGIPVSLGLVSLANNLAEHSFAELNMLDSLEASGLKVLLSEFVEHQLEREMKVEKFFQNQRKMV
jgi:DNA repair protein RecO (recombination protein O)